MDEHIAEIISNLHNVTVVAELDIFNTGADDIYGWQPVPDKWVKEAKETLDGIHHKS